MKKRVKSCIGTVVTVLCIAVLLFAVILIARNARGEVTFLFGKSFIRVRTASMEPGIGAGSYILVARVRTEEIAVGDVITFRSDDPAIQGQLNTHRVTEILDGGAAFRTKGDNNPVADKYVVPADHVVARYVRNLDGLTAIGRAVFARNIFPVILLVLSAAVFVCAVIEVVRRLHGRADGADPDAAHEKEIERRVREEVERLKNADAAKSTGTARRSDAAENNGAANGTDAAENTGEAETPDSHTGRTPKRKQ